MCVYYIRKHTAHISTVINPKFTHQYYIYIFIGINVNLGSYEDPHAIAGALKLYFRELPIPLIPFDSFDLVLIAASKCLLVIIETYNDSQCNMLNTVLCNEAG